MANEHPPDTEAARERHRSDFHTVIFLLMIWGCSTWHLVKALVSGVIFLPSHDGIERWVTTDSVSYWLSVAMLTFMGPVFMIGTAVFLWIGRNDPH